jgi:hypothetical protein
MARLAERQRIQGVGNDLAADDDRDAFSRITMG